jgi:hypothetical protein
MWIYIEPHGYIPSLFSRHDGAYLWTILKLDHLEFPVFKEIDSEALPPTNWQPTIHQVDSYRRLFTNASFKFNSL